jgi:hypothetical protein
LPASGNYGSKLPSLQASFFLGLRAPTPCLFASPFKLLLLLSDAVSTSIQSIPM